MVLGKFGSYVGFSGNCTIGDLLETNEWSWFAVLMF